MTSMLTHPNHIYVAAGTYTVALTISKLPRINTMTHTNYITAYPPVHAGFTAAPTEGVAPLTVTFTNSSTGDYTASLWDFGDGITSTQPSPTRIASQSLLHRLVKFLE